MADKKNKSGSTGAPVEVIGYDRLSDFSFLFDIRHGHVIGATHKENILETVENGVATLATPYDTYNKNDVVDLVEALRNTESFAEFKAGIMDQVESNKQISLEDKKTISEFLDNLKGLHQLSGTGNKKVTSDLIEPVIEFIKEHEMTKTGQLKTYEGAIEFIEGKREGGGGSMCIDIVSIFMRTFVAAAFKGIGLFSKDKDKYDRAVEAVKHAFPIMIYEKEYGRGTLRKRFDYIEAKMYETSVENLKRENIEREDSVSGFVEELKTYSAIIEKPGNPYEKVTELHKHTEQRMTHKELETYARYAVAHERGVKLSEVTKEMVYDKIENLTLLGTSKVEVASKIAKEIESSKKDIELKVELNNKNTKVTKTTGDGKYETIVKFACAKQRKEVELGPEGQVEKVTAGGNYLGVEKHVPAVEITCRDKETGETVKLSIDEYDAKSVAQLIEKSDTPLELLENTKEAMIEKDGDKPEIDVYKVEYKGDKDTEKSDIVSIEYDVKEYVDKEDNTLKAEKTEVTPEIVEGLIEISRDKVENDEKIEESEV